MPKIGRRQQYTAKMPEEFQTKNLDRIKLDVALNITVPPNLEKKAGKLLERMHNRCKKMVKEWAEKLEEED